MSDPRQQQNDRELDHLLASTLNAPDAQLEPSSGFTLSVMDAVRQDAAEPAPLAFPWHRLLPGVLAALVILTAFFVYLGLGHPARLVSDPLLELSSIGSLATPAMLIPVAWISFAVALTLTAVFASFRLAGRR
jgi:hypothetical protein